MTKGRQKDEVFGSEIERRDIPLSSIWDQVTSEFGEIFSPQETAASTSLLDVSTAAPSTPTTAAPPTGQIMTTSVAIPISTVTVAETSFRTTFVTVQLTTDFTPSYAPTASTSTTSRESTSCTSPSSATSPPLQISGSSSSTETVPLPTLISSSRPSGTSPAAIPTNTREGVSAPSATADEPTSNGSQKHAIIGGLSGSIAGLVLIGLIACLLWRRRKPRFDDDDTESEAEKGLRPMFARKWSEFTAKSGAPQPPPPVASRGSTPEPEPDGQILRVSLDNWARPYARDQGFRESQGPTTLRVMNPDLSRPSTPLRPSMETAGSFLKRQRNALAAALYGRPNSRSDSPARSLHVPASNVDPALSSEFLAPRAYAPSVRSTTTNSSAPIIVQHPPEDPFLTPPDENEERREFTSTTGKPAPAQPAPALARPGIAPLQTPSAGGSGIGRTLSNFGNTLNPFRTRSNASASSRSISRSGSRHSASTFSSAGDPFMLDRPSLQSNFERAVGRGRDMGRGRGQVGSSNVMVYEGT